MNGKPTFEERFWEKVKRTETCWIWTATKNKWGYGYISVKGRFRRAHRVAYEKLVGPIPDGLSLDHSCNNPACVNPAHLRPMPIKENILRGNGLCARNARKTHCPKGHLFSEHGRINSKGRRECRICSREYFRQRRLRS